MQINEYDLNSKFYSNSYPWLSPEGIGNIYDEVRGGLDQMTGPVKSLKTWALHLLCYYDGQFQNCQLFSL